jgi:hypothetical protein
MISQETGQVKRVIAVLFVIVGVMSGPFTESNQLYADENGELHVFVHKRACFDRGLYCFYLDDTIVFSGALEGSGDFVYLSAADIFFISTLFKLCIAEGYEEIHLDVNSKDYRTGVFGEILPLRPLTS